MQPYVGTLPFTASEVLALPEDGSRFVSYQPRHDVEALFYCFEFGVGSLPWFPKTPKELLGPAAILASRANWWQSTAVRRAVMERFGTGKGCTAREIAALVESDLSASDAGAEAAMATSLSALRVSPTQ